MSRLENQKVHAENSSAGTAVAARDQRSVRMKSKTSENRGRNQEPTLRNSSVQEECAKANHDLGKGSSQENSPRHSIAKDQDPRLPDGCQLSRLYKPAPGGRLDSMDTRNLTTPREIRDTPIAWRLPELLEVNVEALENPLKQSWMMEKDCMAAVEGTHSAVHKKERGSAHFLDQPDYGLISQESAAMEELGEKGEERVVSVETLQPLEEQTVKTKDVASQDRKITPECHAESQHLNKVRHPRSSMISPKPAPAGLQTLSRADASLQAWKILQDSLHPPRKMFLIPTSLNEKFEQKRAYNDRVTSKSMDDHFASTVRQVEIIFKEKSSTELQNKKSPQLRALSCEDKFHRTGEVPSANDSKILGHLGNGLKKQVLSGAVIVACLFALWPKNGGPVARYHVVKAGETLSSIAPGQCTDRSSNFCRINPRVCDQQTIYPGQRIRLP